MAEFGELLGTLIKYAGKRGVVASEDAIREIELVSSKVNLPKFSVELKNAELHIGESSIAKVLEHFSSGNVEKGFNAINSEVGEFIASNTKYKKFMENEIMQWPLYHVRKIISHGA